MSRVPLDTLTETVRIPTAYTTPDNTNTAPLAQYELDGVREITFSPDQALLYVMREGEIQRWGVR